jgi:putative oxidoreductase
VAALQSFGGLLLVLGLLTPWVAGALAVVMAAAVYKQSDQGFVLGADFPFVLLCVLLALVLLGSGRLSVEALLGG